MATRELERRLRRLEATVPPPHPASEPPAETLEAIDAQVAAMLRGLPEPDDPLWGPEHHRVLAEAAALHRRWWAHSTGAQSAHDLIADPGTVVQVARILREAGVG